MIEYKLFMDWYGIISGSSDSYFGVMQVTFRPDLVTPLNKMDIDNDTTYLRVDSVVASGRALQLNSVGSKLNITLDKNYNAGDTGVVELYYHVVEQSPNSQKGFYYYYGGEQLTASYTVPHTLAYTMSEPADAHDWMPCYDDPSDKAMCEISVRVPSGYTAASNGTLVDEIDNHDGSLTFDWKENYPIATYLMCVTAARFAVIERSYTKSDGSTIPIRYYVYPEDSSGALSNSDCSIDTVASMIKFYESLYGAFPFDKYCMTGIEPFGYGGMEHQTITTLLRKYEFRRDVVAHELAHQWWGDMVTLGTWNDIWLNESFATYSEAMQLEHLSQSSFENEMQNYENEYFNEYSQIQYAIYAPPPGYVFGLAEYYKGAWVLNMLRYIVGDSTFFAIFRTYRSDFQFGNAVTLDFENVVGEDTHSDMSWFFDEWIFQPGYPVYSYTYRREGSSLVFYLKQVQTSPRTFKMPVEFAAYFQGGKTIGSFVDSSITQTFTIPLPVQPDSVVFDPADKIMKRVVPWSDTTLPYSSLLLSSFPNPFTLETQLGYTMPAGTKVSFEIYDVVGRKVRNIDKGYQEAGTYTVNFNGSGLASGVYFCRMSTDLGNRTIKLLLEK
ncbi:MAG TPA: M1 family aminopeptidase [Candidatus Acidoferrales bacterium]|nr:M1 family aminopeptidase [Candidatus Acidoferrales bacterium]